jgi:hypothetical protein
MPEIAKPNTARQTTAPELLDKLWKSCSVTMNRQERILICPPKGKKPADQLASDLARHGDELRALLTGEGPQKPCTACRRPTSHGFLHTVCIDALLRGLV